ncbi:MAG TPA: M12 family metallo-peptidase [Thermoanaerobaculia bacterium]|nr:M12 family metallo-peptidase [Thermoanaerobaculia bacterium]
MQVIESRHLARAAATAPVGGRLRVEKVRKPETGETATFVLERFQVFTPDATITVHGAQGDEVLPAPANAYFRGVVAGRPDSRVFLAVLPDGKTQGVVNEGEETYLIGAGDEPAAKAQRARAPLAMRRVDAKLLKASREAGFQCGNELLPPGQSTLEGLDFTQETTQATAQTTTQAKIAAITTKAAAYTARVAIETDYEFYAKFNNSTTASTYIGNLIGFASTLYQAEINTSLAVQSISLWTTSTDPWNQTTATCSLMQFGRYWNLNKTGVSRSLAFFLSGRAGSGVSWTGGLCSGAFGSSSSCSGLATDAPWGGGYAFTGGITGSFNILSPTVVWDIMSVAHEIGHSFNSLHTHCYNGIGGNASPVDQCRSGESGCYAGTQALPGPAGIRSGTLMSYCHLLAGSYGNIALTFGTNHPYGVQPGRVPSRMSAYVASKAAANPACLAP